MQLRLATLSDAEAIRTIYNAEVAGSTATFDLVPRNPEEQRVWLTQHGGAYPAIVADDEADGVVGFGSLSLYRDRPAYATSVENSVYVGSGHRGSGIGRALMDELITLATQHGFHTMVARIGDDNAASIALHLACGFELVGVEREIGRKFSRWLDVSVLQRML
ncbi:MAG TPA: GNAT family N-acetyltransferase [Acidimicrobiales bacterium]|jgi:phosphinothricin acetyltransferase|nr:GNAT family N-acetyltransferase [Acidimicrobiales bacterium]